MCQVSILRDTHSGIQTVKSRMSIVSEKVHRLDPPDSTYFEFDSKKSVSTVTVHARRQARAAAWPLDNGCH